jgi:serine/threonine protein kinase
VRVFDFGRFGDGVFITMELMEGRTLQAAVQIDGALSFAQAHTLLSDILSGLGEANRRRVIHRDLKLANVFMTGDGAEVMDFGIARAEDADPELTRTSHVVGSPMFMSPEQLEGKAVDARSDLYSLGVLTFFVLAGREPFTGTTATALALKHLGELPPTLPSLRAGMPPEWDELLTKLLEKDQSDRYASTDEVAQELKSLPMKGLS